MDEQEMAVILTRWATAEKIKLECDQADITTMYNLGAQHCRMVMTAVLTEDGLSFTCEISDNFRLRFWKPDVHDTWVRHPARGDGPPDFKLSAMVCILMVAPNEDVGLPVFLLPDDTVVDYKHKMWIRLHAVCRS